MDDDENELLEASRTDLSVMDTALGRAQAKREADFSRLVETMPNDKWEAYVAVRDSIDTETNSDANDESFGAIGEV